MTYPRQRRAPAKLSRTTLDKRVQLTQLVTMRARLDNLTAEDLHRWTGLPVPECAERLNAEIARREAQA